jgi:YesN/AraC family two-component response regulator
MKYPHSFPLWRSNGELLPGGAPSRLVLSSVGTKWNDVVVEQHHFPSSELADVMHKQHVIAINVGHCITWEFKKEGRLQRAFKARGALHQYLIEARVRKAKELLISGKFTIGEAAFRVGFVDQSHLTRHFKRVFGLPPKRLLESQRARDCALRL